MPTAANESSEIDIEATEVIKDRLILYRRKGSTNSRCVVFVHGIAGDIRATWRNGTDAKSDFIQLILTDEDLRDYDVFSFGYRSTFYRGAPIDHAAIQLKAALSTLGKNRNNIVFIAHSMGGLVCMKYIVDQLQKSETPPVSGLLLYGTPTTGSDLVNIAKLVGYGIGFKIPGAGILVNLFLRGQRQLTDLATGSDFLARLHAEWAYRVVNGGHETAGAQRMWLAVRAISGEDDIAVKEGSSKGVYGAIDWEPLSYNHRQLVKPENANDDRFLAAKNFLQISRRTDAAVVDQVWKASQDIWASRFCRVSRDLYFFTAINQNKHPIVEQKEDRSYGTCTTICHYDFVLEKDHIEFGVSFGDADFWNRPSPPVYVHQIGLDLLPQQERKKLRSSLDAMLDNYSDNQIWSFFFPELSITVDGLALVPDCFEWPNVVRKYANWLLRRYTLPKECSAKVGSRVKLEVKYRSIIPFLLPHFVFSAPWIVHRAEVKILVEGTFEYFVPTQRLIPWSEARQTEDDSGSRREVGFIHNGIMLPGSALEVRWQLEKS